MRAFDTLHTFGTLRAFETLRASGTSQTLGTHGTDFAGDALWTLRTYFPSHTLGTCCTGCAHCAGGTI